MTSKRMQNLRLKCFNLIDSIVLNLDGFLSVVLLKDVQLHLKIPLNRKGN